MSGVAVFLGPSLPRAQAEAVLDALYLPPVRQGDVYRLVRDRRPAVIGIVDGYFHQVPSVWHKEILWALDQGVHVVGAASMGALRAAELHVFGMRGVGRIFEAFRDGVLDADDEVAVVHAPAELGFMPVSEALVDIRATVDAAVAAGILRPADGSVLIGRARAMFYAERSWDALLDRADGQLEAFADWLPGNRVARKRLDALALLESLREPPTAPFRPDFRFEPTLVWERFRAAADAEPPESLSDSPEAAALAALRLDPGKYLSLSGQAAQRLCALAEAARRGAGARPCRHPRPTRRPAPRRPPAASGRPCRLGGGQPAGRTVAFPSAGRSGQAGTARRPSVAGTRAAGRRSAEAVRRFPGAGGARHGSVAAARSGTPDQRVRTVTARHLVLRRASRNGNTRFACRFRASSRVFG